MFLSLVALTLSIPANAEKFVDVSVWNTEPIDWATVKANGVAGAMIRCGYGSYSPSQVDKLFAQHIQGASAAGLRIGIYHYSYASSVAGAENEADFCLSIIEPYRSKINCPVAYDMEEQSITTLGKKTVTDMAIAFANKIRAAGFTPMLYCNLNWARNFVDMDRIYAAGISFWIAQWASQCTWTGPYDMWQYTDKAVIPGFNGVVDASWCYSTWLPEQESWLKSSQEKLGCVIEWIEKEAGIQVDGILTREVVNAATKFEVSLGDENEKVRIAQRLFKLNFPELWNGEEDGFASQSFMEAVHHLQNNFGLPIASLKDDTWEFLIKGQ